MYYSIYSAFVNFLKHKNKNTAYKKNEKNIGTIPKTISSRQVGYNPENLQPNQSGYNPENTQPSQTEKNTITEQERIRVLYRDSYERIARRESDSEKALDKEERIDRYKANRHIPSKVRNEVWVRDEGKCVICGIQDNLHFDHIIPLSRGGGYTSKNIQILCSNCNLKKSNKIQ